MTDNKDPQIREAFEKFHAEQFGWELTRPEHYQDIRVAERFRIWQAATEQQSAELKQLQEKLELKDKVCDEYSVWVGKLETELEQLRADNEISESTQAALYKSLLIIQRKYEQLRAERAGLLEELQEAYDDPRGDIMWRAGIARAMGIIKSRLTDSAQRKEGE